MKKVIVVLLLCGLVVFCLLAAVGGFFGYKWYKVKKQGGEGAPSFMSMFKKEPPPEIPSTTEPQPEPETQPAPETPPPTGWETPSTQPPTTTPPPSQPKPKPRPSETAPVTPEPSQPATSESSPYTQPAYTEPPPSEVPPAAEPYAQPKRKGPRGTLGLIFETGADAGDVLLHVDEELVEKQTFRASSQAKFRLTKSLVLPAGLHNVRVTVVKPDGKTVGKEWQVDVAEGGNPVWKAELNTSGKTMDLKQIQAR